LRGGGTKAIERRRKERKERRREGGREGGKAYLAIHSSGEEGGGREATEVLLHDVDVSKERGREGGREGEREGGVCVRS